MDKQKEKQKYLNIAKQNSGITLIALVITIIVLLILAGVALATLTGNTSIINNANKAVEKYNASANEDQKVLNQVKDLFAKYMGGEQSGETGDDDDDDTPPAATEVTLTAGQSASVDASGYATIKTKIVADAEHNIQIVIPTGFAPAILSGSNSTTSNPGQDGSIKNVMPAAQWSSITAAQINAGVVIKNAAGEEFVWVPIPNSSDFARAAWKTRDTYQLVLGLTDNYWDDTSTTEYINMVNSVNANKGFYMSRYEASQGTGNVAQSKRGQEAWCYVTRSEAIAAISANPIPNAHLIYGIEWDSTIIWIQKVSGMSVTDSRYWGNYNNSPAPIGVYTPKGSTTTLIRTTGYHEYWKANNIYDMAGNVLEMTQENSGTDAMPARGGYCGNKGDKSPAADRLDYNKTASWYNMRFPF